MSKTLYALINPIVKTLLRSPAHGLMSHNTVLLEFTGRKSGRQLSTPVSYQPVDGALHCFTGRDNAWWRNLRAPAQLTITLRGKRLRAISEVIEDDTAAIARALSAFLVAVPRDASFSGVALDAQGCPDPGDVARASERLVLIRVTPDA